MGKLLLGAIVTGIVGLIFAYIGKQYFGISSSWVTINIDLPSSTPSPAQEEARRADEARRRQEEHLAAIRRQEEQTRAEMEASRLRAEAARAEAEANRRRVEAARAAEEAEAVNRRMREAAEAERLARARRVQEWRNANGGCDPPLRRQCMTMGSSGGGPRQVLGCTCVR
jgi:hypothetical protein